MSSLPQQLYELDFVSFFLNFLIIIIFLLILEYILYFISIVLHEFGHFVFGLKSKLTFVSFNILGYVICLENNKLKLKKETKIPGVLGYCNMSTDIGKLYTKKSIILFFLGGIIFNFIYAFVSIILIFVTSNKYLNLIYVFNAAINIYLFLYNLIPAISKSGAISDALQIIYYLDDDEYINTMSKLHKLQSLLANGCDLKNIDSNLFCKPKKIKTNSDILNAMIYVDYLSSKEQYHEASGYAKKILKEAKELLSKQNIITLKLQLMNCIFYDDGNFEQIKEIWDEDVKKYLDLMGKVVPVYIGFNYMYAALIEKNELNSNKYLNQFQQLNKKNYDKYQIDEIEQFINDVNKKKREL